MRTSSAIFTYMAKSRKKPKNKAAAALVGLRWKKTTKAERSRQMSEVRRKGLARKKALDVRTGTD